MPGYEASAWHGVGVPRDTPTEIIEQAQHARSMTALAEPKSSRRGSPTWAATTADGLHPRGVRQAYMPTETEKWGKVVKFTGIKPE